MIPKTTGKGNNNQTCAQDHFACTVVHRKRKDHIQKYEPGWGFWLRFYKALIMICLRLTFSHTLSLSLSISVFPLWLILYKISISSLSVIWEGHSALASLSRSHTTWPDFPILHQILTRISFSNFYWSVSFLVFFIIIVFSNLSCHVTQMSRLSLGLSNQCEIIYI